MYACPFATAEPSLFGAPVPAADHHRPCGHTSGCRILKLKLNRRDDLPGSRALHAGADQHLVIVSQGRGHVELERGGEAIRQELSYGSVEVYPAGLPIRWSWRTPLAYSVLALDPAFLDFVARRLYGAAPGDFELLPTERNRDFIIATLVGPLAREATQGGPDQCLYLESLANVLAAHLLRHYSRPKGARKHAATVERAIEVDPDRHVPEPVQRAMVYIERHHAEDIDLRDIARAARCSKFHLARTFKQNVGMAPHHYLMEVRVRSAHALLSMVPGRLSVAEVAAASGFSDQSHLTRHFKRILGVTPRQVIVAASRALAGT
jgi:AraC family transcriptional regulator